MARKDALLNLHAKLVSRRKELLGTIEEQLGGLHQVSNTSDELDFAAISMNSELTSQLAEHESREIKLIERALFRLREGNYGDCEVCSKKIPIERLNALPYTSVCVLCQRELENNPELREQLELRVERAMMGDDEDEEEASDEDEESQDEELEARDEPEEEEEPARRRRGPGRKPQPAPPKPAPKAAPKPKAKLKVKMKPKAKAGGRR